MSSGNHVVDEYEAEQRRLEKRHNCECGADEYTEEPWCREMGCDCHNNCYFKQDERGLVMRLIYRIGLLKGKPDPKCEFFTQRAFCDDCGAEVEL